MLMVWLGIIVAGIFRVGVEVEVVLVGERVGVELVCHFALTGITHTKLLDTITVTEGPQTREGMLDHYFL